MILDTEICIVDTEICELTADELDPVTGGLWHLNFFGVFEMGTTEQGDFYFCQFAKGADQAVGRCVSTLRG